MPWVLWVHIAETTLALSLYLLLTLLRGCTVYPRAEHLCPLLPSLALSSPYSASVQISQRVSRLQTQEAWVPICLSVPTAHAEGRPVRGGQKGDGSEHLNFLGLSLSSFSSSLSFPASARAGSAGDLEGSGVGGPPSDIGDT